MKVVKTMPTKSGPGSQRKGVAFTMYFSVEQAQELSTISRERKVSKSVILRFALERLLEQIKSGQLKLPFGM
jgi:transposase